MKIVKLDRRYAGFPAWKYAVQFPLRNHAYRTEYFKYKNAFQAMYGADAQMNPDRDIMDHSTPMWLYNEHWRADFKRQRILVKDQALVTMIQLKITV
jgi:hypothetical protein